ncbi:MAG TPA: C39 family peptidase [Candidatus Dormibacteraeota bacterium]|nr:C39 family peptidase [Candidatus Dormibacteraeota bacterium]
MTALIQDLRARVDAATITKASFRAAADEIALAGAYGVTVYGYQATVESDYRLYGAATTVAQFNALTTDVNQVAAQVRDAYVSAVANAYHIISGIQFYYQIHSLSCEETAVSMALTHQGIYVSQDQILADLGADTRPMYVDGSGVVRWGNPYLSFVGSVNGSEHNYTGYQANYPPLVRVAQAHGASIIAAGSMSAEYIYAQIIANHPVVAYATWDWARDPRHDYLSFDGQWIPWVGPNRDAHVYTVIGVNPWSVLVNDPIRGQYWVSKATFEAAYSTFSEAIVFA